MRAYELVTSLQGRGRGVAVRFLEVRMKEQSCCALAKHIRDLIDGSIMVTIYRC